MFAPDSTGIYQHFGINGSGTDGRFLWSFRYNSKFPGAAGDHRKHLAAIRLSSQNRGHQVTPPSLQDHRKNLVINPGASPMAESSKVNGSAGIGERNFHPRTEMKFMVGR